MHLSQKVNTNLANTFQYTAKQCELLATHTRGEMSLCNHYLVHQNSNSSFVFAPIHPHSKGQTMKAFYKVGSLLVQAYDMGDDWKIVRHDGKEQWFSKWQQNEYASLSRAFYDVVTNSSNKFGVDFMFNESLITLCDSQSI